MSDRSRAWVQSALSFLLVLGAFGWVVRANCDARRVVSESSHWRILDREGARVTPPAAGTLRLSPGEKIAVAFPEGDDFQLESIHAVYRLDTEGSVVEASFTDQAAGVVRVRVGPSRHGGVFIAERWGARRERTLASAPPVTDGVGRMRREELVVHHVAADVVVRVDGSDVLSSAVRSGPWAEVGFGPRGGDISLIRLVFSGDLNGEAYSETIDRGAFLGSGLDVRRSLRAVCEVLVCALFVFALLRALCLGRPAAGAVLIATAVVLALPAAYAGYGLYSRTIGSTWLVFALSLPGWLLALFLVRDGLRASNDATAGVVVGEKRSRRALAFGSTLALMLLLVGSAVRFDRAMHAGERREELQALGRAPDPTAAAAISLGPHNAVALPGAFRSFDLRARARLTAGSVLQLRLRAKDATTPLGTSLFLGADSGFRSGLQDETRVGLITRASLDDVSPEVPHEIGIEVRGREVRVVVDGREAAVTRTRLFPEGSIVALAAAGTVHLEALSVTPRDDVPPPSVATETAGVAIVSTLLMIAVMLALAWVVPLKLGRAAWIVALGAAPITAFLAMASPVGGAGSIAAATPVFMVLLWLSVVTGIHGARATRWRRVVFLPASLALGGALYLYLSAPAWPATAAEIAGLSCVDASGAPLSQGLQHLQHAQLRRWNTYLAEHELRGRRYALQKAPGTTRIMVLGTSSAYGFHTEDPWGFKLERGLNASGEAVEVLIAAVQGGSVAQQRLLLENALLPFKPDIIVASFFYNDAVELAQADQDAYFDAATAAGRVGRWLLDARTRLSTRAEMQRFRAWSSGVAPSDEERASSDIPPARFERALSRLADLARREEIDLVLVKEPTVLQDDRSRPRPWTDEMRVAMDAVSERFGLVVVDPGPAIAARGGKALFLDAVHPTDAGHEVMAEALLPAMIGALARDRER